jgi:hypothetical protein
MSASGGKVREADICILMINISMRTSSFLIGQLVDRIGKDTNVFQLPGRKPSNTGACGTARFPHNINTEVRPALR